MGEGMKYESVIGLEVHAELLTRSKMFCGCEVVDTTEAEPNRYVCPVCAGMPGVLPVVNRLAVEYAIKAALALNCKVQEFSQFARKSYFYPDLPKGYQISQYEQPFSTHGWLDIEVGEATKRIGITRAHLEEDTGKLYHINAHSLVDLNRAGVPLLEIVSEPDFRTIEEIEAYARKVRSILVYLGINHGDMSKGVLRFEANVSIRPRGETALGTRTEIKNLNSIRALVRAVAYEIDRQIALVEAGGKIVQDTMGFNEATGETYIQRHKESSDDYRYFPEPDLPPLVVSREWVEEVAAGLPELPDAKRDRFMSAFGLSKYDAGVLVADKSVADYYEATLAAGGDAKEAANWITGELFRLMNASGSEIGEVEKRITPGNLAGLIGRVDGSATSERFRWTEDMVNSTAGRVVLGEMFETGKDASEIIAAKGLAQISDEEALGRLVDQVLDENPEQVAQYLGGKEGLFGWFVGQVMRATRGQANAQMVNDLLAARLNARRGA
jgi:aspartyl-tRNA(Asn)/glutamyl-tRNA(Gln) amidotransferase subunit B